MSEKEDKERKLFMDRQWTPQALIRFCEGNGWNILRAKKHMTFVYRDGKRTQVPYRGSGHVDLSPGIKGAIADIMWPRDPKNHNE